MWGRIRLSRFTARNLLSLTKHNVQRGILQALVNVSIARGDSDAAIWSENNLVLQIKNDSSDSVAYATVQRFRVTSVQGDYLTCRTLSGTSAPLTVGSTDFYVAKPPLLRNSVATRLFYTETPIPQGTNALTVEYTYGASTQIRTAHIDYNVQTGIGYNDITEWVTPAYSLFGNTDEIMAIKTPGTGVSVNGTELQWLDLNVDGRQWTGVSAEPPL